MIPLKDKTNVSPPDGDFPFGSIRDRDGSTPGTPGNKEVYNDMHQFIEKMVNESDVVPNGLLDSDYNGWQVWEAFFYHIMPKYESWTDAPNFILHKITTLSGSYKIWNITHNGLTEIDFTNNQETINIVSFGKNNPYAPLGTVHKLVFHADPAGAFAFTITINSTNAGASPVIRKNGIGGSDQVWTILTDQVVDVVYTKDGWHIVE